MRRAGAVLAGMAAIFVLEGIVIFTVRVPSSARTAVTRSPPARRSRHPASTAPALRIVPSLCDSPSSHPINAFPQGNTTWNPFLPGFSWL